MQVFTIEQALEDSLSQDAEIATLRKENDQLREAIQAVKSDPMACHSIAVWELVNAALSRGP